MKRPAKVELKNGERFLTEVNPHMQYEGMYPVQYVNEEWVDFESHKKSYFTDDTTLIEGEVYDLDDFDIVEQVKTIAYGGWRDLKEKESLDNLIELGRECRQVARKKAVAETPVCRQCKAEVDYLDDVCEDCEDELILDEARRMAVMEPPVKEWDWYGWLCARIPELKSKKNKWWLNQCVHELVNCKPEFQGKNLMANGEWAVNEGKEPEESIDDIFSEYHSKRPMVSFCDWFKEQGYTIIKK